MGDVKMLAMIGAFLGWQLMLVTLLMASLSGSVFGGGMVLLNRGRHEVPRCRSGRFWRPAPSSPHTSVSR